MTSSTDSTVVQSWVLMSGSTGTSGHHRRKTDAACGSFSQNHAEVASGQTVSMARSSPPMPLHSEPQRIHAGRATNVVALSVEQ